MNVGTKLKTISLETSVKKLTKPNAKIFLAAFAAGTVLFHSDVSELVSNPRPSMLS